MLRVKAQPGQLLIAEGEVSDWMMILLQGTVDVGKRKIGAETDAQEPGDITRLAVLKEGAVIGEMSMLDGEPRYASCWALSEVEAAVLTRAAVGRLISSHPAVGAKLLVKLTQLLAQRLRNTSSQLVKVLQHGGKSALTSQAGKKLEQAQGHQFHRERRQDQAHQPGHHIDAGLAQHPRNRVGQRKRQGGGQADHHAVAHQGRQLQETLRLLAHK